MGADVIHSQAQQEEIEVIAGGFALFIDAAKILAKIESDAAFISAVCWASAELPGGAQRVYNTATLKISATAEALRRQDVQPVGTLYSRGWCEDDDVTLINYPGDFY